jgi:hypothetical protein
MHIKTIHEGKVIASLDPFLGYATALIWMMLHLESKN